MDGLKKLKFPEHEKLKLIAAHSQVCGEFVEWLGSKGFSVGGRSFNLHHCLAEFFEIDEEKIEEENRVMLEQLRWKG